MTDRATTRACAWQCRGPLEDASGRWLRTARVSAMAGAPNKANWARLPPGNPKCEALNPKQIRTLSLTRSGIQMPQRSKPGGRRPRQTKPMPAGSCEPRNLRGPNGRGVRTRWRQTKPILLVACLGLLKGHPQKTPYGVTTSGNRRRQTNPICRRTGRVATRKPRCAKQSQFRCRGMVGTAHPTARCRTGGAKQTQLAGAGSAKQSQSWARRPRHCYG